MEAKEIVERYKGQIVSHQKPTEKPTDGTRRATSPLEREAESLGNNVVWDDNISFINSCVVLDIDPKEITERSKTKLIYIINEFKRLGNKKPEEVIIKTLSKIGSPPNGQDIVSHLSNYLKLRSASDKIGSEKSS